MALLDSDDSGTGAALVRDPAFGLFVGHFGNLQPYPERSVTHKEKGHSFDHAFPTAGIYCNDVIVFRLRSNQEGGCQDRRHPKDPGILSRVKYHVRAFPEREWTS